MISRESLGGLFLADSLRGATIESFYLIVRILQQRL